MRTIEIVLTDLASDKMKSEEELQRLINNNKLSLDDQVSQIKNKLRDIVETEQMIAKWTSYTTNPEQDNNNK